MLPLIGWREYLALPDLDISSLKAKTDTGARTSCLHVQAYELTSDGSEVRFSLETDLGVVERVSKVIDTRLVRDSGGHESERPFIRTRMLLGSHSHDIELSLTQRHGMKFRMLLGRVAIAGNFLVDPAANYLIGKRPGG